MIRFKTPDTLLRLTASSFYLNEDITELNLVCSGEDGEMEMMILFSSSTNQDISRYN